MKNMFLIGVLLSLCLIVSVQAQEEQPAGSLTSGTIASQFEYLNSISNNYQEYKVVKKTHLDQLRSNVVDSLKVFQVELGTQKEEIRSQQAQLAEVNRDLLALKDSLQEAEESRDNFSFFNIPIHKSAYNTLVWSIIGGLSIALTFFLFKFFQSHRVVQKAKRDLEETMEEFEQHRRNTLERERKLKRELVDALNKNSA
ncbi:hypothetical protein [Mongoliitalea daihaiensis]|uniref:hypothetical protein n=1 Tax=Mongoliitalea daihaiensis TaxID=2782006 RepID=UPI001F458265|nr:hypothetical protein [Mongoliitalea daihaiensis]UJP66455.1 hypothetical protein IPZ59_07605 [Mongoliitalea daihaiensis]